jgi:hypothetical protein
VIELATLPLQQRKQRIAEHRANDKHFACSAVRGYMECLHVSLDDLLKYFEARAAMEKKYAQSRDLTAKQVHSV